MEEKQIVHPNVKDSRVLTYLNQRNQPEYVNTEEENILLGLWRTKYYQAKAEAEKGHASPANLQLWRDAYRGKLKALDRDGKVTEKQLKAVRKMAFELVESKINAHIPAPKMTPRYHADLVPVNCTEELIRHEIDRMLSEQTNDEAEHSVCIDSLVWFRVLWNPFDNTHERSGMPEVVACPVDTVFPQPGVKNYKRLEYIFELTHITIAECIDLYNREIKSPSENDIIQVVNCYYLNEDRYVGKFSWAEETGQVLCNDLEWGIRRRRECNYCHEPVTFEDTCPVCGQHSFSYKPVKTERLEEDLQFVTNPYRVGKSDDINDDQQQFDTEQVIPKGTKIPHYLVRQLPFVPYRRIGVPDSLEGLSEVEIILENQDIVNKFLNKAERKSDKSQTYVTKLKDTTVEDDSEEVRFVNVESPQEGQAIQVKQVTADITEEVMMSNQMYDIAKSTVGVTDTDQGKNDPSARSGKAKQLQMAASASRNDAPNNLRNMAYAGVYELIFKNLLAFSDETRAFVRTLPDGTTKQEVWSKYMFLATDNNGEFYYRDDFAWSVDTATEITQDRAAMWQLIDNDFLNGTLGTSIDPNRALLMFWSLKDMTGYPLAKYVLAFLKDTQQHLPSDVEQALVNNPEAVQMALSYLADMQKAMGLGGNTGSGQGGARPNSGRPGNGATHAANVEKTNNKNRAAQGQQTSEVAGATGGMQGGTQAETVKNAEEAMKK